MEEDNNRSSGRERPADANGLLKMHWNPEHAQPLSQWPEQHLDVSSTTSSPAHKPDGLYGNRGRGGSYAWANDDISALTASNLLKRYAEKYSGALLDSPYDRPSAAMMGVGYPDGGPAGAFAGINVQKVELEPWPLTHGADGGYSLVHDGLAGPKLPAASVATGTVTVVSSLSDSGYSGSSSCSGSHSGDYPPGYPSAAATAYLPSGYCPQTNATLVPGYAPSSAPIYNYPPAGYAPHQGGLAPSYGHASAGGYLATPTPLPSRPTAVGGSYGYQNPGGGGGGSDSAGSLKRKAFEMGLEDEAGGDGAGGDGSRYRKYGYDPMKGEGGGDSPYGAGDNKGECRGGMGGSGFGADFKPGKPSSQPLVSPPYGGGGGEYSPPAGVTGDGGGGRGGRGFSQQQQQLRPQALKRSTLKTPDPRLLELVGGELLDCSPALLWGELAGLAHVKAALEEDVLWPALRPGPALRPPRTLLLFGPRGGGKTTLARSLASQLGASFYRLCGATLATKWKAEAEQILAAALQAAGAGSPSVVLISQVEALEEEEGLRAALLAALEEARRGGGGGGGAGLLVLVCATRRPDLLRDAVHRSFAKRYHVGLPDAGMRRQVLLQTLAPRGCGLNERELGAVLQRTEGFSVWELLQLCQHALSSSSSSSSSSSGLATPPNAPAFKDFESAFGKVRTHAAAAPKEMDTCMEWSKGYGQ